MLKLLDCPTNPVFWMKLVVYNFRFFSWSLLSLFFQLLQMLYRTLYDSLTYFSVLKNSLKGTGFFSFLTQRHFFLAIHISTLRVHYMHVNLFHLSLLCVCMICVEGHICHGTHVEVWQQFYEVNFLLPLLRGFQASNSKKSSGLCGKHLYGLSIHFIFDLLKQISDHYRLENTKVQRRT